MERPTKLNYLYCMNINCQVSIYHRMMLRVPCATNRNRGIHKCSFCDQPLISDGDILINHMISAVSAQKATRLSYLHN